MALEHVCVWDDEIGYRRVSIGEACDKYPLIVSANSGIFVCELCGQNVLLTGPGRNMRHFRHDSQETNKECEDRQKSFDPDYGQAKILSSGTIRLRINVSKNTFTLQLVFYCPPGSNVWCDKIEITDDYHNKYEYDFERIKRIGSHLEVGSIPSRNYYINYINENFALKDYWEKSIRGVNPLGSFFDERTGIMLLPGAKASSKSTYYLLQDHPLYSNTDIGVSELAVKKTGKSTIWHLYRINIKSFSMSSAKFFLERSVFLTKKPTAFYPMWPPYTKSSHVIYHNADEFYFYLCGDDAVLRSFPESASGKSSHEGRLYRLNTRRERNRAQIVSIGSSGALGFAYLIKQPFNQTASPLTVLLFDCDRNELTEETYTKLPKRKYISVSCQYDGKAVVMKDGKAVYVYKLSAGSDLQIDSLTFGMEIRFYQGCDCVRTIKFERPEQVVGIALADEALVTKLRACGGPTIAVSHAVGSIAARLGKYPKTKRWLYAVLRQKEISRKALQILKKNIPK